MAEELFAQAQQLLKSDAFAAAKLFNEAAQLGHPGAQFSLAFSYSAGRGVPMDYALARVWYAQAAEQGHSRACFNLGVLYEHGYGVSVNPKEAFRWFAEAKKLGHPKAAAKCDELSKYSRGSTNDAPGDTKSEHLNEGFILENGLCGVSQDMEKAVRDHYLPAAKLNCPHSTYATGKSFSFCVLFLSLS